MEFEIDLCVVTAFKWKISRPDSITYLNCTHIFEWCVVRCGTKMDIKKTCV